MLPNVRRKAKDLLPPEARRVILQKRSDIGTYLTSVESRSEFENIYHCCVQKTASQWLRRIFSDPRIYRHSGLRWHLYPPRKDDSTERPIVTNPPKGGFPKNRIVSPLYMSYDDFVSMEKPNKSTAFFVKRDPRDIVVSFYDSTLHSHLETPYISRIRSELRERGEEEGLMYAIDELESFLFPSMRSWEGATEEDSRISIHRFEDLTDPSDDWASIRALFERVDIKMPEREFFDLMGEYAFENLAGRSRGEEDKNSNYRKGVHGDWKNRFTPAVQSHFDEVTYEIQHDLGYV